MESPFGYDPSNAEHMILLRERRQAGLHWTKSDQTIELINQLYILHVKTLTSVSSDTTYSIDKCVDQYHINRRVFEIGEIREKCNQSLEPLTQGDGDVVDTFPLSDNQYWKPHTNFSLNKFDYRQATVPKDPLFKDREDNVSEYNVCNPCINVFV